MKSVRLPVAAALRPGCRFAPLSTYTVVPALDAELSFAVHRGRIRMTKQGHPALRYIAAYKFLKALGLLLVAVMAFGFVHTPWLESTANWIAELPLRAGHGVFIRWMNQLLDFGPHRFVAIGVGACIYATLFARGRLGPLARQALGRIPHGLRDGLADSVRGLGTRAPRHGAEDRGHRAQRRDRGLSLAPRAARMIVSAVDGHPLPLPTGSPTSGNRGPARAFSKHERRGPAPTGDDPRVRPR